MKLSTGPKNVNKLKNPGDGGIMGGDGGRREMILSPDCIKTASKV